MSVPGTRGLKHYWCDNWVIHGWPHVPFSALMHHGAEWCRMRHMANFQKSVRQSVSLPARVAKRVRVLAKRSEEHTSELQSRPHLVCRLLLEKKKNYIFTGSPY